MAIIDYIVLCLYLLGTFCVGLLFTRRNKSAADMFAAGGQSPWWTSGLSAFMTMFSANTFVVGGHSLQNGLGGSDHQPDVWCGCTAGGVLRGWTLEEFGH